MLSRCRILVYSEARIMQNSTPQTGPSQIPGHASAPPPRQTLPPEPQKKKDIYKREGLKSILSTVLIIALAPILALVIVAFVFQSYQVDGPSMQPTLETNDRLIIWKFGRTWARLTGDTYMPERGAVVVFIKRGLYDFSSDREKQLIKRVIGLPGDRVVVSDGTLTVFNNQNPDGFDPDKLLGITGTVTGEITGNTDITVKEGEIFVVGDHRDNSLDSRAFGAVPAKDIVGTLSARILPLSEAHKF